jgi:DNA polymerase (family X)
MKNADIAKTFRKIGFMIEIGGNDINATFRARAYKRTSDVIASLSANLEEIYRKEGVEGLQKIPSIGKAIALKIEECIMTGKIKYFEVLKATTPINIDDFYSLESISPKTLKVLYDKLKIKDLSDLEKAASEGKLRNIPGFSQKKEETILKKIQMFKKGTSRYLLGEVYPIIKQIETRLSYVKGVKRAVAAGSFRRMKETVGDIDYVVVSDIPEKVMDYFVKMPEVDEVISRGLSKTFVRLNNGMDVDLLVVPEESFGSSLQYFTGNKEHGVAMRKIALAKGLHLNEWGIFDNDKKRVAGFTEEEVYQALELDWIPPEMRENIGEIELAKKRGYLPRLINYDSLKGDLQVHTNNTDGTMSIEEMALSAKVKFGLEYIAITDHTKSLKLTHGLDEEQILDQANKISEINDRLKKNQYYTERSSKKNINKNNKNNHHYNHTHHSLLGNFRILSSAEVNIMKDGSLDVATNVLDKLDIVGAAIHSSFVQPIEVQTDRLIKAAQNPSIDIIFHPTGRLINKREGYPVNVDKLIEVAKDTDTVLEIDAHYDRLDLKDEYIRMAVENNIKLVIDSDAHHPVHFAFLKLGIGQARRGWAKQSDILNTLPIDTLLKSLK